MATRGRSRGGKTIEKRVGSKRKRQCELGNSCPYQHEYQHQQEFSHDDTQGGSTKIPRPRNGRKPKETIERHTSGALKGTGPRGRVVAVATDRRRAERAVARDGDGDNNKDPREAQKARWVRQMQEQVIQQQHAAPTRRVCPAVDKRTGSATSCRHDYDVKSSPIKTSQRQRPNPLIGGTEFVHDRDEEYVRPEPRTPVTALQHSTQGAPSNRMKLQPGRGSQERERRRTVELLEISSSSSLDSNSDGKDEPQEYPSRSSCSGASILHQPQSNLRDRDANWASCRQSKGKNRGGRGAEGGADGWNCKTCTFRNSNTMGMACAVCRTYRIVEADSVYRGS